MNIFPSFHKQAGIYHETDLESSPVAFGDRLLLVNFVRGWSTAPSAIRIRDFFTKAVLKESAWPGGFGSVFVLGDKLHLFGVTDPASLGNALIHSVVDVSFNITSPETIYTAPGDRRLFNSGVAASPTGYVMILERQVDTIFLHSPDLETWTVGGTFAPNASTTYCGSPKIRFLDGWFHVTHLAHASDVPARWDTWTARSRDLASFQYSNITLLTPQMPDEGNNTSDFSYAEFNGHTHFVYLAGSQSDEALCNLKSGFYPGTVAEMFREVWN